MPEQVTVERMYAALSATNEAIMRTNSPEELFQRVCDAAVYGSKFIGTAVAVLVGPATLRYVAASGREGTPSLTAAPSMKINQEQQSGLIGEAFLTGRPSICNDYLTDPRIIALPAWRAMGEHFGVRAAASVPIIRSGKTAGIISFFLEVSHSVTDVILAMMVRMAENIAFALDNFDRERMFLALTLTNEAILRSKSPEQMFQMVCDAAADGGKAMGTAVFMHDPDTLRFAHSASAGRLTDFMRTMKVSSDPDNSYGRGVAAVVFKTARPAFVPDIENSCEDIPFRDVIVGHGVSAGAVLPLMRGGKSVGLFYFFLNHGVGSFDDQMTNTMTRIVENVSFALDMFERKDAEDRITRMFAALGATNEAIMRAQSRDELFQMVCAAAIKGGKFSSTTIALTLPDSDLLRVAAVTGPGSAAIRALACSVCETSSGGQGLMGNAFRSGKPCYSNDYMAEPKDGSFHPEVAKGGARSGAALPLFSDGKPVGVLLFVSKERNNFTPALLELLERLARNLSFALDNFNKAEERQRADDRIQYLATHDEMTSLPNRLMFSNFLDATIKLSERHQRRFAVLFIDLDRFKVINDTLGHAAGDKLLVETGRRIRSCLRKADMVARLGGDEFVVILNEVTDDHGVAQVARNLLAAMAESIDLQGHECRVTASIGIAIYPDHGVDEETLTKNADMAMYLAKEEGKNGFRFFSKDIKTQSIEHLLLETSLRHAMERDQFTIHYQPKVDLISGRISGVEALIRWNHPDMGLVAPMQFIPLAEETGLIVPIGRWVLRTACQQSMDWQRQGLPAVTMAVNLSPRQFSHESLLNDIDKALADSGMPAEMLQLEVTESMVMQNVERAIAVLDAIKRRGVRLAIDDFGTGYSSMSLIKRFPIDTLKIDRSFIKDLPENDADMAIAQAIIAMGKALGLTIIAEGVETSAQQAFLSKQACDEMQGYLFSKPVTPDAMFKLLEKQLIVAPPLQPGMETRTETPRHARASGRVRSRPHVLPAA